MTQTMAQADQSEIADFTGRLFAALTEAGLSYAVLRGYEGLPEVVTHDIDMGTTPDDFGAVIACIKKLADETRCPVVRDRAKSGFRQIYVLCGADILKLDLWCELTLQGRPYLAMERLLETRTHHNGIPVLPPESEALLTALKEVLHTATISAPKVALVLAKSPDVPARAAALGCPQGSATALWDYLKRPGHPHSAKALRAEILAALGANVSAVTGLGARARFLSGHLRDRLRPTGRFVVLLGPDGSGKTTLSQHLMAEIDARRGLNGRHHYVHGRFGILPNVGRLRGRSDRAGTLTTGFEERKDAHRVHSAGRVLIYMGYYFWDFVLGYGLLARLKRRDTLIIADRYFYDFFLQNMYKNHAGWVKALYLWLLPRPDRIVFLHADPDAIVARKPELTAEEIAEQQAKIETLLAHPRLRARSTKVPTDTDEATTRAALRRTVYHS